MKGVSIYPNGNLKRELERLAKKDNRSLSNFVLLILTKYIRTNK